MYIPVQPFWGFLVCIGTRWMSCPSSKDRQNSAPPIPTTSPTLKTTNAISHTTIIAHTITNTASSLNDKFSIPGKDPGGMNKGEFATNKWNGLSSSDTRPNSTTPLFPTSSTMQTTSVLSQPIVTIRTSVFTVTTGAYDEYRATKGQVKNNDIDKKDSQIAPPSTPAPVEPRVSRKHYSRGRFLNQNMQIAPPNRFPSWNQKVGKDRMAVPGNSPPIMPHPDKADQFLEGFPP